VSDRAGAAPGPWVGWVDNGDDPTETVRYLQQLGHRRVPRALLEVVPVVVRPTPGGGDRTAIGFDVLTALGKNPNVLRDEQFRVSGHEIWDSARAWLMACAVTDVVVDRAHQLSTAILVDLAGAALHAGATPWLIWSSPDAEAATLTAKTLTAAGLHVARMPVATMRRALTAPIDEQRPAPVFPASWPALPAADFTTFRAACRRHLGRDAFARVDQVYRAARDRTDQQMVDLYRQQHSPDLPLLVPPLADIAWPLLGWLRDVQLGPAPDAATALITLRATQAALFGYAILLRGTPDALGPDPAGRLLGDLTPRIAATLALGGRTDTAAATVLSLHLNHAPTRLHCFQVGDIAADGATVSPPPTSAQHHHGLAHAPLDQNSPSGIRERSCAGTIVIPEPARPIIAAHLAFRRLQGAQDTDPYFVHSRVPGRDPTAMLRIAAQNAFQRLHLNPPWLHRDPCRYGADIGLTPRTKGWLVERSLSLAQLDRYTAARRPAYRYPTTLHE